MKPYKLISALFLPLFLLISRAELRAQVGNDNPTGPSGVFNGNVTTGGSYDPYTGNAVRTITDMVVAGAVGQYGLSYSRTWNTRTPGWQHSYNWSIEDITVGTNEKPEYVVNFPDGRREVFNYTTSDVYYRTAPGVRERLQPWSSANGLCYLVLPDGGKVEFHGTRTLYSDSEMFPPNWYEYSFTATAIIDPYGQRTTFEYYADGNLKKVIEPAGRSIQLFYTTVSGRQVLDYIKGSDNREVHYTYQSQTFYPGTTPYTVLTNVTYSAYYGGVDDPPLIASYTYRGPNVGDANGQPLLSSCDDPIYAGAMKKINYTYKIGTNPDNSAAVYAQLDSEASINGIPVSSLAVTGTDTRKETRGDGPFRTFTYANGYLVGWTDFKGVPSSQIYDNALYVASVTDERGYTTNFINNPLNGVVTQIQYPLTPNDTPLNTPRGTVYYTYGWANCPDPNNRDANNPYYLYSFKDEAGNETKYTRDANKRITRIDYPDNAYETFTYNSFGQVLSHVMKTGGTETFTYDVRGLRQTYRDPDHVTGNPTSRFEYDALDRLSKVTDALGSFIGDGDHTVSYVYNTRGQLRITTLPTDPVDSARHTRVNTYNPNGDGTLVAQTDPMGHTTSYTYDDYRRIRSVTTPQRFPGDTTPRTAYASYDTSQNPWDDYRHTDANITRLTLPSGKLIKTIYDANHRKTSVTACGADGVTDSATTGFEYDDAGNLSLVKEPDPNTGQASAARATTYHYDERNRPSSVVDALTHTTSFQYDQYGRKLTEQRPNGQTVTYNSYDSMNRLLQRTVTQAPTASAVTNYTWWPSGLLHTMQDPNTKVYTYQYDLLGRKLSLTYPADSAGVARSESYTYDPITGNLQTYTNRAGNIQTFLYDNQNRQLGFDWNDGFTPQVRITYDAASRPTRIWNWDATIDNVFFDDNKLASQTETTPDVGDNTPRTVNYTYDADGNRGTMTYYVGFTYNYHYTGRNQLKDINYQNYDPMIAYQYDKAGNRTERKMYNKTTTTYGPVDALNRSASVVHTFAGGQTAHFDYAFDEMSRLKYEQRNSGAADGYSYDQSGAVVGQIPNGTLSGNGTVNGTNLPLSYDAAGNRTNTWGISYATNDLNQYTSVGGASVTYDANGNIQSRDGWTYVYDAQNRLRSAIKGGTRLDFYYDGLNRQITRGLNYGSDVTFSVWDGWNLLEERGLGNVSKRIYFWGGATDELVCAFGGQYNNSWFTQDGRGNTSHILDDGNNLVERYTYGLSGEPQIWDPSGNARSDAITANRFMFQGRDYLKEGAIYDYRNRFYLPTLGRFIQTDPLSFRGGDTNLYRYCGGDPVNRTDPSGLMDKTRPKPSDPTIKTRNGRGVEVYSSGSGANDTVSWIENTPSGGDHVFAAPLGPLIGLWGERSTDGMSDFGPNDHGTSGAGRSDGGGGGDPSGNPSTTPVPPAVNGPVNPNPYLASGPLVAEVWKDFDGEGLKETAEAFEKGTLYYTAGVTLVGGGPTIYAGTVVAANASFDALLYAGSAGYIGYQTVMANPPLIVAAQQFGNRIGTQPTGYAMREMWKYISGTHP